MTFKKSTLLSLAFVLTIAPSISFSATSEEHHEYWDRCPQMTLSDFQVMADGGHVWDSVNWRATYYKAVDSNAAQNMKTAIKGLDDQQVFAPKTRYSFSSVPFSNVCVYPIHSNGIEELWVKMYHVQEPDVGMEDYRRMLRGEMPFAGFSFLGTWDEQYTSIDDSRLYIANLRSSKIPTGTFQYDVVLRFIDDMCGSAKEMNVVKASFSLKFDPTAQ